jgi:hypothetical protein
VVGVWVVKLSKLIFLVASGKVLSFEFDETRSKPTKVIKPTKNTEPIMANKNFDN